MPFDSCHQVHRVKFAIRREENAEVRTAAIEETLCAVGNPASEAAQPPNRFVSFNGEPLHPLRTSIDDSQRALHPELVAQLLCLRAREHLKARSGRPPEASQSGGKGSCQHSINDRWFRSVRFTSLGQATYSPYCTWLVLWHVNVVVPRRDQHWP